MIPELTDSGRVIAPDLIGLGDSDKLPASDGPGRYSFQVAYGYLEGFLTALGLDRCLTLVVHDWGSGLGFEWAYRHPAAVKGIAYMEAIVMPLTWDDWPDAGRGIFKGFRSDKGEDLIIHRNLFVEGVLPASVLNKLDDAAMAEYRRPFVEPEDRRVTLNWPREIPIDGEPAAIVETVKAYGRWLASAAAPPKLFINADPGSILTGRQREFCRTWPNQTEVTVKGIHFVQEDSGPEIGQAVAGWLRGL